ncbi:MAG: cysteine hydrolase family protein [Blautia sp.]|jgi:nicotinamidase/pyrazinamidase
MKYLIVVDMQNDFIDGALGTAEAQGILDAVEEKIQSFDGKVLFTRDTHEGDYLSTQEGKYLPVPHCIRGTKGWEIHPRLQKYCTEPPIDKPAFGSTALAERLCADDQVSSVESITLIGLCTDICVISNSMLLKAYLPEVPILVDAACCAGVTKESHKQALNAMRVCQILIENED